MTDPEKKPRLMVSGTPGYDARSFAEIREDAFVPSDQAIRDVIRRNVDENMCVEAGAGTGKTSVLVDRIVEILRTTDTRADELAVITFTEKAAAELASRVRRGLEDALAEAADDGERERIATALRDLNRAHIETIHAFASGLLRERPVEAKLDPGFTVLDEMPGQLAFDTAWQEWINGQMAEDPPPQALLDVLELKLEFHRVREAADRLNNHRDMLPLGAYAMPEIDIMRFFGEMGEAARELRERRPRMKDEGDYAFVSIPDWLAVADGFLALREHPETLARAFGTVDLKKRPPKGNKQKWVRQQDLDDTRVALNTIYDLAMEYRGKLRQTATVNLLHWLEGFIKYYEGQRQARGEADFNDLLIWARDLVRGSDEVRRYFGSRYKRILVDEFQDTDPLQVEMIVRICAEDDPGDDWRSAKPRPGSLFVVGDPKQSIYRFRRADIGMYDDVKQRLFGGVTREIAQNFRSVRPIIDWVNSTFGALMHEVHGVQPKYIDLAHDPRYRQDEDAVTYIDGVSDGGTAPDVRRAEADAIAALLKKNVTEGAWRVRDRETDELRTATYRDVTVLIPNRTELHLYEQAFARAELPYRHEGGRTFFARQEVRELVAVLRAIDDPSDGVATVAALRSSAFGCSDEDLMLYRQVAKITHGYVPAEAKGDVADALRVLREFSKERHTLALPDLIRRVLDRTRLVEFAMLQPQGDQVAANLLKVIDQARAFIDARGGGLRGFVRWLKNNIDRASDMRYGAVPEAEAAISEETDQVVRILTVHAAKGLEFSIVVFANMDTSRSDYTTVIPSHDRGGPSLELRIGSKEDGFQTPGFDDAETREHEHREAEDLRLLYVATTRARDRVVVPLIRTESSAKKPGGNSSKRDTLNNWLKKGGVETMAVRIDAASLDRIGTELPVWRRPPIDAAPADVRDVIETREAWLASHVTALDGANAQMVVRTASSMKLDEDAPSSVEGQIRRGKAAEFGTAVHALLDRIDLGRPDDAAALSVAVAREFSLPGREHEIEDAARQALASDAVARARRSSRLLREAPFTTPLPADGPPGLAEGRIDLLFEEDGGIVIVDFKTDRVTHAEADIRTNGSYRTQALVYAWAAYRATGLPVREVVFLFVRPDPVVESTIMVDDGFMAEAEALMRQPAVTEG